MSEGLPNRLSSSVLEAWYSQHAEALRAFLMGVLKDRHLADEALQATFTKAVEAGHSIESGGEKGWLFRVAYHEAMNLRRRQGIDGRALQKVALSGWQAAEGTTPDSNLMMQEKAQEVQAALLALPEAQRQIVGMRIYEDKTFAEIAAELTLPLGTVLSRMRLALGKLQKLLGPEE